MRYKSILEWISTLIGGGKILYIGSVDDDRENIRKHNDFYRVLSGLPHSVLAVYHSDDEVLKLKRQGLAAVYADPETMELGEKYELILSLDNIEHMSNCGNFIRTISHHLLPAGMVLITTPNPTSLVRIVKLLFFRRVSANRAHTCWFTRQVLDQLARRYGLEVVDEVYIDDMYKYYCRTDSKKSVLTGRMVSWILTAVNYFTCFLFPQFCETYGYVLRQVMKPQTAAGTR